MGICRVAGCDYKGERYTTAKFPESRTQWNFRRQPSGWKGWAMEKWMCFAALGAAAIMLIVFLMDLAIGVPFGGSGDNPFIVVDIFGIVASAVVGYLGFNALRDVK